MEVIVQDANNIVIEVDQGRQGRGVEDVSLITVGADYYLLFTFTDGTTDQVGPIATTVTEVISAEVRNAEAVTILKGQPVYLYQAQGNLATVKLAYNTSDATSAKTLGLAAENIAPNAQGLVTCQGTLGGLNTSAYNEGDTLYLGATAGTLTNVKPQAPNHLVYIGVVERANAGAGQIYVRVQNGFELDEIHDVRIISPVNGNTLIYDASTSLWKNAGITAGSGINVTNGPASITVGNTGVLSFSGGTTGLTPATATTGAVSLAGTLSTANGGTGLSSFTANGVVYASSASALTTGSGFTFANERLRVDRTSSGDVLYGTALNANVGVFLERTGASPGSFRIIQTDSQESYFDASSASHKVIWRFNSVEQMRLTSTGLGIGTSSPGVRLDVAGSVRSSATVTASYLSGFDQTYISSNGATGNGCVIATVNFAGSVYQPITYDASTYIWRPNGTERMRLDSTGNLGIGTNSPGAKLEVFQSANNNIRIGSAATSSAGVELNANGGTYGTTTFLIQQNASQVANIVNNAAQPMTFATSGTERMRLDSSGNLGIGTSTPTAPLHFGKSVYGTTSSENFFRIKFEDAGGIQNDVGIGQPSSGAMGFNVDTSTGFYQWNIGTTTERMRLDAYGNLLVGTTTNTNSSRLTVNGTISETVSSVQYLVASQFDVGTAPNKIPLNQYLGNLAYQNASAIAGQAGFSAGTAALPSIASATDLTTGRWFPAAGVMAWSTGGSERMRLDSSGRLLIGSSSSFSSPAKLQVQDNISLELNGTGGKLEFFSFGVSRGFVSAPAVTGQLNIGVTSVFTIQTVATERLRITDNGIQIAFQPAEYAQNTSATLTVGVLLNRIVTSNAAVTLTLPTGTDLEGATSSMATNTAFECTFIATTANAITIAANGNTTVGSLTVAGNTSGTFRFRKTAANTFTVYRVA